MPLPVAKYTLEASRTASAAVDFATTDLEGGMPNTQKSTYFRLNVVVGTGATAAVVFYYGASTTNSTSADFNGGSALIANNLYQFVHEARGSKAINYRFGSAVTIKHLYVTEFFGEVV